MFKQGVELFLWDALEAKSLHGLNTQLDKFMEQKNYNDWNVKTSPELQVAGEENSLENNHCMVILVL